MAYNYDVRIGNVGFDSVKIENLSTVKSKNRELDFGKFTIPRTTNADGFQMLDDFRYLIDDQGGLFEDDTLIIESDNVVPLNSAQTIFKHELTLVERTKKLELFTIGSRAMVQTQTGTKKSLWDRINELRQTVPFERESRVDTTRIFEMGSSLEFLKDIEAPDFFFNNKTLREAIDEIMDYAGGLARLKRKGNIIEDSVYPFNVLEIDLFNETNNSIVKDAKTESYQDIQNINEYSLVNDISGFNQVYDFILAGGVVFEPNETEYKGVRSDEGDFSEQSSYLPTEYGKYRLVRVRMLVPTATLGDTVIDITQNIVEKDIFDTLIENALDGANIIGLFKSNALIWNFKSDRITALFDTYNRVSIGTDTRVIDQVIKSGLARQIGSGQAITEFQQQDYEDLEFNIAYSPFFDSRMQVEKIDGDTSKVNKRSYKIVNQSENILSSGKVLDASFVDIQQKGVPTFLTTRQGNSINNNINELGDFDLDYLITRIELIWDTNSFIEKDEFSLNYQKRSDLVRVNSQPELFDIPADERTVKRNEYYKEYLLVGFDDLSDDNDVLLTELGRAVILNTIQQTPLSGLNQPIYHAAIFSDEIIKYIDSDGTPVPIDSSERIYLPVASFGGGNTLNFHWQFKSPNIAGLQVYRQDQLIGTKPAIRGVQYTDALGQLDIFNVRYMNVYDASNKDELPYAPTSGQSGILIELDDYKLIKYAGDILKMTFGIHILPNNGFENDIVIGDRFIKRNNIIEINASEFANARFISGDGTYDRFENKLGKTGHSIGGSYTVSGNTLTVPTVGDDSWALVDDENNLFLAVNQRQKDGTFIQRDTVYFIRRKERGDVIEQY
jgi:hypothetical protein